MLSHYCPVVESERTRYLLIIKNLRKKRCVSFVAVSNATTATTRSLILSITAFEKVPIDQLLTNTITENQNLSDRNQLEFCDL